MGRTMQDITGLRSGRLVALRLGAPQGREKAWVCQCDCGNTVEVRGSRLRSLHTRSCGCFKAEETSKRFLKHGHSLRANSVTKTYKSWEDMHYRCRRHVEYAGRGITVCDRWKSFANFLADMGERPAGLTIERKNNEGNYEPGNCCWATYSVQNSNQRTRRPRAKRHGNSLLSDEQVLAGFCDPRSGAEIGRELGVSRHLVNRIKSGLGYGHITARGVFS